MNKKGFLFAIEGIDGSGKSSLIHPLGKKLEELGHNVLLTQESGGTELGKKLRVILHEEKEHTCDKAEYLLFAADRAQHFETVVIPALEENKIVISDRLDNSSVAYQGYGRGLAIEMIKKVNKWAMQGLQPDLIVYLKLDFPIALERIMLRGGKLTSFETEKELFWKRVCDGFDTMFKDRSNVVTLDATKPTDELVELALQAIVSHIKQNE